MQMPEDVPSPTTERHQPDYDSLNHGMTSLAPSGQNCSDCSHTCHDDEQVISVRNNQ